MKHLFQLFFCCTLMTITAAEFKKPIIVCDLQLLATQEDPDASANVPITEAIKLFSTRPMLACKLGLYQATIKQEGKKMAKNGESGAANVTYKVLSEYGKITENDVKQLTSYAINSTVKKSGLDLLRFLKQECNYQVIGLTDQDRVHHEIFRTKIKDAIDLSSELKGIVSLPFVTDKTVDGLHPDNKSWMLTNVKDIESCYQAAVTLADTIDSSAPIVVIKDKSSLVASQADFPEGTSSNERIIPFTYTTLENFKTFLQQQGFFTQEKK